MSGLSPTEAVKNRHFPVEHEPVIPTLDQPVIIECAYPGWQTGGERYPAVPRSMDEQIQGLVDAVRAGAAAIHVHPRDPATMLADSFNARLLHEVVSAVVQEVGDVVTLQHTWAFDQEQVVDYISHTAAMLELGGGNRLCQAAAVLPIGRTGFHGQRFTAKATQAGVKWMEAHGVKPLFYLYDTNAHFSFKDHLFDKGLCEAPYLLELHMGKHDSHAVQRDPWSHLQVITNMHLVRDTLPESIIGIAPGGRNWLPVLVQGLLQGAHILRVGIEDCYWMYPHKNELIPSNTEVIKLARDLATMLGRRVVTDPSEARAILGLKLTT